MRNLVEHCDSETLQWSGEQPGARFKRLSYNPASGASTVLLKLDPSAGYKDQPSAHYHGGTEELLILDGMLSFDRRTWLHRGGYVFHPPGLVHGFDSNVPVPTIMLARGNGPASTTFIPRGEALGEFPYYIQSANADPTRPYAIVPSPWIGQFEAVAARAGTIARFTFSHDHVTGESSSLLRFGAGASERPPSTVAEGMVEEVLVLSGELQSEAGGTLRTGSFSCYPAGTSRPALIAQGPAEAFHSIICDQP